MKDPENMKTPQILNHWEHNSQTFLKTVVVKDGRLRFAHLGKDYDWTAESLKSFEGLTVLVNTAGEIFRSDKKIGNAVNYKADAATA